MSIRRLVVHARPSAIIEPMEASSRVVSRLGELLLTRMKRRSRSSLVDICDPESSFSEPDAELAEHLIRHRWEVTAWIRAVLRSPSGEFAWERSPDRFLRKHLAPWLQQKNQFLHVDDVASRELDALYRRSLLNAARMLSSPASEAGVVGGLGDVLRTHQENLAAFLRARLGEHPRDVVCAEYSPSLQLKALGLSSRALLGPILDVGCGAHAALVRSLRAEGWAACGIDRDAPEDVAVVADWLTFPFGANRWGTVVSHLGFSLHFLHHHLGDGSTASVGALAHAETYMKILRSLRVGGVFAYVPGLPFIEVLLPSSAYLCERVAIPRELRTPTLLAAQKATGIALDHATHVRRLA